jgi:hypothetical protein
VGANRALAQASQRSREFLVEQHELQQLLPSAVIVSYASPAGRRVVLADANPGILGLRTATLHALDEVTQAAAARPGPPGSWTPPPGPEPQPDLAPLPDPLPGYRDVPER